MTIGALVRDRLYRAEIRSRELEYSQRLSRLEQLDAQLRLWNVEWSRMIRQIPFWKELHERRGLPSEFSSWDEFLAKVPVTTRSEVKLNGIAMISTEREPDFQRITGGTTAEPMQMPAWNEERRITRPDMWMARGWYGITPASRLFMIWGHSHLLGTGALKWINGRLRKMKDHLVGYYRFSAYDIQEQVLKRAAEELIRFNPVYVLGYSAALDMFARANLHLREQLRNLGIKVVIATAEAFPASDSETLLRDLFGCEVAMEYGTVETDAVAHTHPDGGYRVFWRNYFLEADRTMPSSEMKVRITSLYPRCFPLVRYEIGDEIELLKQDELQRFGIATFRRVLGRCNAYVVLRDGARIHSEAFSHVLRGYGDIDGYQIVQDGADITLLLQSRALLSEQIERIRATLKKVHPGLEGVHVTRVDQLKRTIAGKTPMVVRAGGQAPVC